MTNIPDLDYRHLLIFEALMKHRSVSRTAEALNLAQPTVSRCLAKLREEMNDALFVRTQRGIEPTPAAVTASETIADILKLFRDGLFRPGSFNPATSRRTFAIAASDFGHLLVIPSLYISAQALAPALRFDAIPLGTSPLLSMLEEGEADIAVGGFPNLDAGIMEQTLFSESYLCLVSVEHPSIKDILSADDFAKAQHIIVSTQGLGHIHQTVEKRLIEICSAGQVRIVVRSFVLGVLLAERSDLILTVPAKVAALLGRRQFFRQFAPPFDLPGFDVKQYWHERYHQDPANRWLRRQIAAQF